MKWHDCFFILQKVSSGYFIIAGTAFLFGYVILRKWIADKKIQQQFPQANDYLQEIFYSVITMRMFAFVPFF